MQITVTFNSLGEFLDHMKTNKGFVDTPVEILSTDHATEPAEAPEGFEPTDSTPFEETPQEEAAPALTEDFRAEVRKTLYQLNKQTGRKVATELINAAGYGRLTEVPLEKLPAIMQAAQEALHD